LQLLADDDGVYWIDQSNNALMTSPLAGGTSVTLVKSGLAGPIRMALQSGRLFWWPGELGPASPIMSVGTSGGPPVEVAQTQVQDGALGTDATYVYWTGIGLPGTAGVFKAPLAGGAVVTLSTEGSGQVYLGAFAAVTATNLYWVNADSDLATIPVAGGAPTVFPFRCHATELTSDGTNVYWVDVDDAQLEPLLKLPPSGGAPVTLVSRSGMSGSLAIDATSVYWTEDSSQGATRGNVMKMALAGGTPVTLATDQHNPGAILVHGDSVYWANDGTQSQSNPNDYEHAAIMRLGPTCGCP
jgi:hypothetical protein